MTIQRDINNTPLQGFAPYKIVEITQDTEWVPEFEDRAFRNGVGTAYYNSVTGSAREATLSAGAITVIVPGYTYTFDTTQELEVM